MVSPTDCPTCRRLSEAERGRRIISKLQEDGAAVLLWLWPVTTEVPGSDMLIGKLAITDRAVVFGAYAEQDRFPWIGGGALGALLSGVEQAVLTKLAARRAQLNAPDLQQGFEKAELIRAILAIETGDVEVTRGGSLWVSGSGTAGMYELPKLDMESEQIELLLAEAWNRGPIWYNRGLAYAKAGRYESATRCLKCALTHYPKDADIWYSLGYVLAAVDQLAEARQAFVRALELRPDDADSLLCKAEVEETAGLTDDAIHTYERFLSVVTDQKSKAAKQARKEMERLRRLRGV